MKQIRIKALANCRTSVRKHLPLHGETSLSQRCLFLSPRRWKLRVVRTVTAANVIPDSGDSRFASTVATISPAALGTFFMSPVGIRLASGRRYRLRCHYEGAGVGQQGATGRSVGADVGAGL